MRSLVLSVVAVALAAAPLRADTKDVKLRGKSLGQWVDEIKSKDPSIAENAMKAIARYGKDAQDTAGPVLLTRLDRSDSSKHDNRDPAIRCNAALTISVIGLPTKDRKKGALLLRRLLTDDEPLVRLFAIMALGKLGPCPETKPAIVPIRRMVSDRATSWQTRQAAAYTLGEIGYEKEPSPQELYRNIETLVLASNETREPSGRVREEAIHALLRLGPPKDNKTKATELKWLERSIKRDPDKRVVVWAHVAMMQLGLENDLNKRYTPHLEAIAKFLTDPDWEVKVEAAQALGGLGRVSIQDNLGDLQRAILKVAPAKLTDALHDEDTDVATAVATALADIGTILSPDEIKGIGEFLKASAAVVRGNAARAVGMIGRPAAGLISSLITMVSFEQDSAAKVQGILALGQMGEVARDALPLLQGLTQEPDQPVRRSALIAIERITHPVKPMNDSKVRPAATAP
jgi:HEAT repeat protein